MTGKKTNGNGDGRHLDGLWWTGGDTIAANLGINRHDIRELVRNEGFPAFKWRGRWRILPEDAIKWSRSMARKYKRTRAGPGKAPTGRPRKAII